MARVGIREVAGLAGVAARTVSHYLNHPAKVSDEKAARIRAAIETLGFVPNNAGRQLRLGKSSAIAYIAPDVSNPFFAEIAESVERRASERGVSVFIAKIRCSRSSECARSKAGSRCSARTGFRRRSAQRSPRRATFSTEPAQ